MWTIFISLVILVLLYQFDCRVRTQISETGARRHRQKREIRQRAFNRACGVHTCRNLECSNEDGWYLYGSDWGCCGNYDGCCTWASTVCYYHDVMCKCCDYGWLICGPDCKPETECFEKFEEQTNQVHDNKIQIEEGILKSDMSDKHLLKHDDNNSTFTLDKERGVLFDKQVSRSHKNNTTLRQLKLKQKKKYVKWKSTEKITKQTVNVMLDPDDLMMADQPPEVLYEEGGSGDFV